MDERTIGEDAPASAADALAIIEREQARRVPDSGPFYLLWGIAWVLIGLGWFAAGRGMIDQPVAGIVTLVVALVGVALSIVLGRRIGRGVAGPSSRQGAMYGTSWGIAIVTTVVVVAALSRFGGPVVGVVAPTLFLFVVGLLYTAGAVFWRQPLDYGLGIAVQVVAAISAFTDPPWNSLVVGVLGGGALIVVGSYRVVRHRSSR